MSSSWLFTRMLFFQLSFPLHRERTFVSVVSCCSVWYFISWPTYQWTSISRRGGGEKFDLQSFWCHTIHNSWIESQGIQYAAGAPHYMYIWEKWLSIYIYWWVWWLGILLFVFPFHHNNIILYINTFEIMKFRIIEKNDRDRFLAVHCCETNICNGGISSSRWTSSGVVVVAILLLLATSFRSFFRYWFNCCPTFFDLIFIFFSWSVRYFVHTHSTHNLSCFIFFVFFYSSSISLFFFSFCLLWMCVWYNTREAFLLLFFFSSSP